MMVKPKIKVGSYYEFKISAERTILFAVMYGFEKGKNKDVYTVVMYTDKNHFEFPIRKSVFDTWVEENRIREITADEAVVLAL